MGGTASPPHLYKGHTIYCGSTSGLNSGAFTILPLNLEYTDRGSGIISVNLAHYALIVPSWAKWVRFHSQCIISGGGGLCAIGLSITSYSGVILAQLNGYGNTNLVPAAYLSLMTKPYRVDSPFGWNKIPAGEEVIARVFQGSGTNGLGMQGSLTLEVLE
jgi:hypothetical protein